jgi:uncharacterized protein (TIGR03905 family)
MIFKTKGTCSQAIEFEIENGVISKCSFTDGCRGNLEAVSRLVINKPVPEVIAMLEGIKCRNGTSCADQLAKALKQHLETE